MTKRFEPDAKQFTPELEEETPEVKEPEGGDSEAVKEAKDQAEIAKQNCLKTEAETKANLLLRNFQTIEDGLTNAKLKEEEAAKYYKEKTNEADALLSAAAAQKAEAQALFVRVQEQDKRVKIRLEEAVKKEQLTEKLHDECDGWFKALQSQETYHRMYIIPCRKVLDKVARAIYGYAEILEPITRVNTTQLYNFIGKQGRLLDNYLDHTKAGIPVGVKEAISEGNARYTDIEKELGLKGDK